MAKRNTSSFSKGSNVRKDSNKRSRAASSRSTVKPSAGEIRLIGGDYRGRKLPVLDAEGLRPTSDRVRETLFNWLQFDVPGATVLDVFAGSGALGFESLSRGAKRVVMLELSAANAKQLKTNAQTLKAELAEVIQTDSLQWLSSSNSETFDIVFCDPPFHQNLMQETVEKLFQNGFLDPKNHQAWLYLEQENTLDWPDLPPGWICHREKSTSQVKYGLFRLEQE